MSHKRLATWTWSLIFGGMLTLALGLTVQKIDPMLGWVLVVASVLAVVVGIVLIWLRSTMNDTDTEKHQ
jgi:Mn2+/Fe2+ NRAMP family transporter